MNIEAFLKVLEDSQYQSVRPKYVLIIHATDEETKLLTSGWNFQPLLSIHCEIKFIQIESNIFYTFYHFQPSVLYETLKQRLKRENFVLAELCALPKTYDELRF